MDLKTLYDMAPWDWPAQAADIFLGTLTNPAADPADRLLAAEMAGDSVVINDELAETLLAVAENTAEEEELRARAVISLGPALEHADIYEFDDPDDIVLSEGLFHQIQARLQKMYHDAGVPRYLRRRVLEVAVRAPQDWHSAAVRAAYASNDEEWRLSAVFCMRFIKGFDKQILEAIRMKDPDIRYQAIFAAGNWAVIAAWPQIAAELSPKNSDREMLFAAIEAAAGFKEPETVSALEQLLDTDDDEIIDAVNETLAMLGESQFDDDYDEEDDW